MIKISPNKLPKEKINSAKIRLNTDNVADSKKQINKTITTRKVEKSPVSNIKKWNLCNFLLNILFIYILIYLL